MATISLSRTNSALSNQTCDEKTSSLEGSRQYNIEPPHLPFFSKPSAFQASNRRNSMLTKAVQRLRSLISAAQNLSCTSTCDSRVQGLKGSRIYATSDTQKKSEAQHITPTPESVEQAKGAPQDIHKRVSSMNSPQKDAHILAPSTNKAYKSSVLFNNETLQFANAFLPTMEPLEMWGTSTSVESGGKPPSTHWIRRHTCIRPGNVIQIPSVADKGVVYLLSCQNEAEVDLSPRNNQPWKLFVAGGGAEQPLGYSRAFIMCKPGPEL